MHSPEPMNRRRDMRRESKGGDDRPESDPDALEDIAYRPVIVGHNYLCWKSMIRWSRISPLQKQFAL